MGIQDLFLYTKNSFSIDFYASSNLWVRTLFFFKMGEPKINVNFAQLKKHDLNLGNPK